MYPTERRMSYDAHTRHTLMYVLVRLHTFVFVCVRASYQLTSAADRVLQVNVISLIGIAHGTHKLYETLKSTRATRSTQASSLRYTQPSAV